MPHGRRPILSAFHAAALLLCLGVLFTPLAQAQEPKKNPQKSSGAAGNPRLSKRTLTIRGEARTFWVAPVVDSNPAPAVIVVLHANGGTGDNAARNGRVHQTGPGRRSFVVYPDGKGQTWSLTGPEDIEFIKAMIEDILRSDNSLDKSKVFAAGAGSGGAFAQRLACEMSDRFAAVALVSAGMPKALRTTCKAEEATPILLIHGGLRRDEGVNVLTAAETFDFWRRKNGCTGTPAVEQQTGPRELTISVARPCRDGAEVRFIAATDDGNPWMEEASREISEFFMRFRRLPRF